MTIWFLNDLARLNVEREAAADLQSEADWLIGSHWYLGKGLQLDATIRVRGREFDITLEYPDHFPFAPPIARPTTAGETWSTHQYPDGTLCLEWGPDNWHNDVTGADMLISAHRLLTTERPNTDERTVVAPSRHCLTIGQELRGKYGRFCTTASLRSHCSEMPVGTFGQLEFSLQLHRHCSAIIATKLFSNDGQVWEDPEVPAGLKSSSIRGIFCKVSDTTTAVGTFSNRSDLQECVGKYGCSLEGSLEEGTNSGTVFVLIIDYQGTIDAYWIPNGDDCVYPEREVQSASTLSNPRLNFNCEDHEDFKIGIVGVGSVGSKIAVSLARHGFRNYVLVDPDVLCAENLVRHQFDWRSVGDHKADAAASAIELLVPDAAIKISKLHLTGQESNTALSGILDSLSKCDLLIDATGDDSVFNLLSAVSMFGEVPLVWGQVFEGGFGGLIARSRPGKDPTPNKMRQLFLGYCHEHPFPQHEGSTSYAGIVDGKTMVAGDVDVTVIATHMAGLTVDTAIGAEPSRYPNSMYLVGLSRGWVFRSPFHTIPLSDSSLSEVAPKLNASDEAVQDGVKFIAELLSHAQNKDSHP